MTPEKKAFEAMSGPTNDPTPLNDCEKLSRKDAVLGSPKTEIYGFAAVSNSESPQAIINVAPTKAPKLKYLAAGQKNNAPLTYNPNPNIIPVLYPHLRMTGPPTNGGKKKYDPK